MQFEDQFTSAADPALILIGLGAVVGLFAALCWWRVWRSVSKTGAASDSASLEYAALATSIALALACTGYLLRALGITPPLG